MPYGDELTAILAEFDFYLATTQRDRFHVIHLSSDVTAAGPSRRDIASAAAASARWPRGGLVAHPGGMCGAGRPRPALTMRHSSLRPSGADNYTAHEVLAKSKEKDHRDQDPNAAPAINCPYGWL